MPEDHAAPTPPTAAVAGRCVLLLQGPRSGFYRHLARALEARGARVLRVLFCPGDALFWWPRPAIRYRGRLEHWPARLRGLVAQEGITDIVGLGDGRPLHATAFDTARTAGVQVHVIEQGYLRPGWLTIERDALGAWQPRPDAAPRPIPASAARPGAGFARFAAMDVAHHAATLAAGWLLYPHFRRHELWSAPREWLGWLRRFAGAGRRRAADRVSLARIAAATGPVFMLGLQLETDFQLRRHGPPGGLRAVMAEVALSFAAHAPKDALLVIKPHPLDPLLTDWTAVLAAVPLAEAARARILWLHAGDALALPLAGLVTVNSTLGLAALARGVAVKAMGRAIYARAGLVHGGALDDFWRSPQRPDPAATAAFLGALVEETQVQGTFDGAGMAQGAEGIATRILEDPR